MTDYDAFDEATLQQMANDAESYEERSAIRQALRRKKKERGENVGRSRPRGNSVYNRFAGSTAPAKQAKPKNFIITEAEAAAQARPPSTGGSAGGRGSSRGSTTPTQRESTSSPVTRPRSPTPPPTPEQPPATRDEEPATIEEDGEGEDKRGNEEVDIEPAKEEEAPLSPPPSPQQPDEPPQLEHIEEEDGEGVDGSERTPVAELPEQLEEQGGQEEQDGGEEEEVKQEEEEERAASPEKEEPSGREEVDTESKRRKEEDSGGARFGGVTLRSRRTDSTPSQKSVDEPQNEFLSFKLRQTSRDGAGGRGRKAEPEPKVDFGVQLKSTPRDKPREKPPVASPPTHKRGGGGSEPSGGAPRTLKDYQELSGRSAAKSKARRERDEDIEPPSMEPDELQKYLVAYVNCELSLHPPLPVKGGALFETCSNPTNLCKLVNKSVPNTVDLRALTKISASASEDQKREALKENMTLALESARAIGCRVSDDSSDNILNRHPQTIRDFLVDLIRAKAVNLPGMDDEPSSTFTNMATLFEKLNISVGDESVDVGQPAPAAAEEVSWRDAERDEVRKALESPPPNVAEKETWREKPATETTELSYEERAAMRRAQRERRAKQAEESGGGTELSYEERAAQRRAERDRRRREREALAK